MGMASSQQRAHAKADALEPRLARVFAGAIRKAQDAMPLDRLTAALSSGSTAKATTLALAVVDEDRQAVEAMLIETVQVGHRLAVDQVNAAVRR
jgi:hypothetical protein